MCIQKILQFWGTRDLDIIKERLTKRGYYINPDHWLILEHSEDQEALAEIRLSERRVILPAYSIKDSKWKRALKLEYTLIGEGISFRKYKINYTKI